MRNILWFALALAAAFVYFEPGHWAMLGGVILLIVLHEFGHWFVARVLGFEVPIFSVGFGSSPRIVFGKFWGTEFQLTPWLIGGYVKIDPTADDFTAKPVWRRAAVMAAGVVMNVLLSIALIFMLYATVGERSMQFKSISVQEVSQTITVARDAGIKAGDKIVAIDGVSVRSPQDMKREISKHNGTPATVRVERGAEVLDIPVVPQNGAIGVQLAGEMEAVYREMGVLQAAGESLSFNWNLTKQMFYGLGMMMHIVDVPEGTPDGAADVRGIVAIVQIGAMAFQDGVYSFVFMLALISMNLALLNILPIPVLDGGHLLFLLVEKVRGKPVRKEVQGAVSMIFMLLLFALMFYGLYNDIFNPLKLK